MPDTTQPRPRVGLDLDHWLEECGPTTAEIAAAVGQMPDIVARGSGHASGTGLPGHLHVGGALRLGGFLGSGW
jgi:hypothetical protein